MKVILAITAALCLLISDASAQRYTVTTLTPAPRTRLASAINERGQVVVIGPITPDGVNRGDSYIYFNGQFQDLGPLGNGGGSPGGQGSHAVAINDHGQVTGSAAAKWDEINQVTDDPFLFTGGQMIDLNPSASWAGQGNSVNNLGVVVGTLSPLRSVTYPYPVIGTTYAFISYNGGPAQALTGLTGVSYAYGINDSNQVVGTDDKGAFIWRNGNVLRLPDSVITPHAINNLGHITGEAETGAFLYSNGQLRILGAFSALAINSHDQIVGKGANGAVLFTGGQVIDLNTRIPSNSGWVLNIAYGINNNGQIVGAGNLGAFLLTPVR